MTDHDAGQRIDLAGALHARAEVIEVPPPPVADLVRLAQEPRRRPRAWVALAAAACLVVVAGTVVVTTTLTRTGDTPAGPSGTSASTTPGSANADPLRAGPAPDLPYLDEGTLHFRGSATPLRGKGPFELTLGTGPVAVVRDTRTGQVTAYDRRGAVVVEQPRSAGLPVVSGDGHWWAVIEPSDSPAVVRRSLTTAPGTEVDRLGLPDAAADAEPRLLGVDQLGRLFLTAGDRAWVWDTRDGNEGVEPERPGAGWLELDLGERTAYAVTSNKLVARSTTEPDTYVIGTVRGAKLDAEQSLRAPEPELAAETHAAYLEGTALSVKPWGKAPASVPLPDGFAASAVLREERSRYLVDGFLEGTRYWLRCSAKLEGCEVAAQLSAEATLPQ